MTADIDGLYPTMRSRVRYMLEDPEARRMGVWVVSAFRSIELQRQLFADAVKRYGSEAAARKWVAPPGKSNHGPMVDDFGRKPGPFGQAVDLGVEGHPAVSGKWPPPVKKSMDVLCARFGLRSPMVWEDWHYEPLPGFVDLPVPGPVAPQPGPVPAPVVVFRGVLEGDPVSVVIVTIPTDGNGDGDAPAPPGFLAVSPAGAHDKYDHATTDADSLVVPVGARQSGGGFLLVVAGGPKNTTVGAPVLVAD